VGETLKTLEKSRFFLYNKVLVKNLVNVSQKRGI
jgi:hypothetical protein